MAPKSPPSIRNKSKKHSTNTTTKNSTKNSTVSSGGGGGDVAGAYAGAWERRRNAALLALEEQNRHLQYDL